MTGSLGRVFDAWALPEGVAALRLWQDAALRVIPGVYLAKTDATGRNPGAGYIRCALVHDLETTEQALNRLSTTL